MDERRTGGNGASMLFQTKEARPLAGSAKVIIEAERRARDEKTARFRAARLAQQAAAKA